MSKDEIAIDNVFQGRYVEEFLLLLDQYMCTWRLLIFKNWIILFFYPYMKLLKFIDFQENADY